MAAQTLSYCGLMIIFGILCHPFIMPLYLISLGSRPLCLVRLVAWACVRHLELLRQPFGLLHQFFCTLLSAFVYLFRVYYYLVSILGKELAIACLSALLSGTPVPEVPTSRLSKIQQIFQSHLDACQSNSLLSSCSLRDQIRICAISSHSFASAWLRAIPSVSLGLTMLSLVLAGNSNILFY